LRAPAGLVIAERDHPLRALFEAYVEARFAVAFDARVRRHYPRLAGVVAADGSPRAVAGIRFAEAGPLFLERYLDAPIEAALTPLFPVGADRRRVAEIGSLASDGPAAALALFHRLAGWLRVEHNRVVAVATATPCLERLLRGAGFDLIRLAEAAPARLGASQADWGGYYETRPAVFAGAIPPLNTPGALRSVARRRRS
jgi:hypothetical protein